MTDEEYGDKIASIRSAILATSADNALDDLMLERSMLAKENTRLQTELDDLRLWLLEA